MKYQHGLVFYEKNGDSIKSSRGFTSIFLNSNKVS